MKVIVREGSAARNFDALAPIISEAPDMTMLCSDDNHPDDLVKGHVDAMVRRGIALGISVWDMLKAAAVNPVLHYRTGSGLMKPGDRATFIAVDNLTDFNVRQTIIDGLVVYDAADGGPRKRPTASRPAISASRTLPCIKPRPISPLPGVQKPMSSPPMTENCSPAGKKYL